MPEHPVMNSNAPSMHCTSLHEEALPAPGDLILGDGLISLDACLQVVPKQNQHVECINLAWTLRGLSASLSSYLSVI